MIINQSIKINRLRFYIFNERYHGKYPVPYNNINNNYNKRFKMTFFSS